MFDRLKEVLVKNYVGAITLGWVFAQGILHFAYAISAPVAGWLTRREYHGFVGRSSTAATFSFRDALPELARSLSLLFVGYFMLRWLYYKSSNSEPPSSDSPLPASSTQPNL
jgi:hypothetical protein